MSTLQQHTKTGFADIITSQPQPARKNDRFSKALLLVFLGGLYTSLGITIEGKILPGAICLVASIFYLALVRPKLSRPIQIDLGSVFVTSLVSIVFSPDLGGFWDEHLKSLLVLTTTLVSVVALTYLLESVDRRWLQRIAGGALVVLLFSAFLETRTPLKTVSDSFRQAVYVNQFIYASDADDIDRYSSLRPNLFTQEPSHLAKFVSAMILILFFLSRSRQKLIYLVLLSCLAYYAIHSLTVLLALVVGCIAMVYQVIRQDVLVGTAKTLGVGVVILIAASIALKFGEFSYLPIKNRLESMMHQEDASTIVRLIAPATFTVSVIKNYPAFGSGIGGKELVYDHMIENFSQYQAIRMERFEYGSSVGWANAFFEIPIYYGIIGTLMILSGLGYFFWKQPYGDVFLTVLIFLAYFNGDSGFVSFRPWCYFTLVYGAIRMANRSNTVGIADSSPKTMSDVYPIEE